MISDKGLPVKNGRLINGLPVQNGVMVSDFQYGILSTGSPDYNRPSNSPILYCKSALLPLSLGVVLHIWPYSVLKVHILNSCWSYLRAHFSLFVTGISDVGPFCLAVIRYWLILYWKFPFIVFILYLKSPWPPHFWMEVPNYYRILYWKSLPIISSVLSH